MTDVLQSYSPCSVSVGFYLPPLHTRLVDLPLLLVSPIQYTLAQCGSLLGTRDVEGCQLPIDWRVRYGLLAWFLRATSFFGGSPPLPVFLRLLGSSSSPSPSRPRFLPPESPAPLVLGAPPSHAPFPPLVPAPPPAVGFFQGLLPPEPPAPSAVFLAALDPSASSMPSSSEVSSSP